MQEKLIEDGFAEEQAKRLALLCVSTLQGSLIQARIDQSGAPIEIAAEELGVLLDARREGLSQQSGAPEKAPARRKRA